MKSYRYFYLRTLILFTFIASSGFQVCKAQQLRIAVAANAQGLIKKLQSDFQSRTGIKSEIIVGSSGKLSSQISNGAPFDVFLSADTEFPDRLFSQGFGLSRPRVYAIGSLIICGSRGLELREWKSLISSAKINSVAIANPKTAPYGKAALHALEYFNLFAKVSSRLVYAESISQVNTYLQTGAVELGFTNESYLCDRADRAALNWIKVDPASYSPIRQSAILLKHARLSNLGHAKRFYEYLFTLPAQKIISSNGYRIDERKIK